MENKVIYKKKFKEASLTHISKVLDPAIKKVYMEYLADNDDAIVEKIKSVLNKKNKYEGYTDIEFKSVDKDENNEDDNARYVANYLVLKNNKQIGIITYDFYKEGINV